MTFNELVAEVIGLTKRPDLQTLIESAVRSATLKIHHLNYYYKDLKEYPIQLAEELYVQTFDPRDINPNFRKLKYIRPFDGTSESNFFTPYKQIQIESVLDSYGHLKTNVFYFAGENVQIRSEAARKYFIVGMYVHPTVTPSDVYSSWIATEYPYTIVHEATRKILLSIGLLEQAAGQDKLFSESMRELLVSVGTDEIPT